MKQQIETPERRVLAPIFEVPVPARPLQFRDKPVTSASVHSRPATGLVHQTLFHS